MSAYEPSVRGTSEHRDSHLSGLDVSVSITEETVSKTSRFDFMENRNTYRIIEGGDDLTPDEIIDKDYVTMEDTFGHAAFESKARSTVKSDSDEMASRSKTMLDTVGVKIFATTINLDDIHIDHTLNTEEGLISEDIDLEVAPSAYYLPVMKPITTYPTEVLIVLKEIETVFLFELPSFSFEKGYNEAAAIEEENEFYQYITVGKGKNRKMVMEETQTDAKITQTRHTLATRPQKKNAISFASLWDMHDTYSRLSELKPSEEPDEMVMYQSAAATLLRRKKQPQSSELEESRGKTFEEIAMKTEFNDAVLLIERVIAAKAFGDAQKKFRGLIPFNPLSLDLVYVYSLKPLWTLEYEYTVNRPITSISFNPKNENILAVAHGKFGYAENSIGLVCVWCTKNPCKPERMYSFATPVTTVAFSTRNPNWLACGFVNGDVLILDITSYSKNIIATSHRNTNPCFEPIWSVGWRLSEAKIEYVMTTCQDGRINRFTSTKTHDFVCTPMMRISTVEGKMKGLEAIKVCRKHDVPITRYPAALCVKWHPTIEHIYLVGTDEGCIHKCSTNYLNQHMDVFRAHTGPVYSLEFSTVMTTLFVSCGADGAIRLWIEGLDEVILTLNCPSAVYGATFCPINSTIIISVSGNILSIWDLRRKTHMPCAEYTFPSNVVLTYIKFSSSGDNVFLGDTTGRVHTFHLEDTPLPAFYQFKMLDETIKKALCTRPHMLKQLDKLEKYKEKCSK